MASSTELPPYAYSTIVEKVLPKNPFESCSKTPDFPFAPNACARLSLFAVSAVQRRSGFVSPLIEAIRRSPLGLLSTNEKNYQKCKGDAPELFAEEQYHITVHFPPCHLSAAECEQTGITPTATSISTSGQNVPGFKDIPNLLDSFNHWHMQLLIRGTPLRRSPISPGRQA